MDNKKVVIYLNSAVLILGVAVIFFNIFQCQYFSQIVFSLAFISVVLLVLSLVLLKNLKETEELLRKTPPTNADTATSVESLEGIIEDEDNKCLEEVSKIDSKGALEKILELKIKKLAERIQLVAGLAYIIEADVLKLKYAYALSLDEQKKEIKIGNGLTGQVAKMACQSK